MAPAVGNDTGGSSCSLSSHATLSASYTNSSTTIPVTKQILHPISAPMPPVSSGSVKDNTAFLFDLHASTKQLQDEINTFLTHRVEEDISQAAKKAGTMQEKSARKKIGDEIEEENYGEEEMEESDDL